MITDIDTIKKELENFSQIEFPYDIKIDCHVKYLTIKDKQEYFYKGGKYVGMTDNMIILQTEKTKVFVPLTIKHPNGTILYKTRLFVVDDESDISSKEKTHYESIIHNQQSIIETMTQKIKQLTEQLQQINQKQIKYETVIQKLIQERNR